MRYVSLIQHCLHISILEAEMALRTVPLLSLLLTMATARHDSKCKHNLK